MAKGDMQMSNQLTSVECLLCAWYCQALTFHIRPICMDAVREETHVDLTLTLNFSAALAPCLVLLLSWPL